MKALSQQKIVEGVYRAMEAERCTPQLFDEAVKSSDINGQLMLVKKYFEMIGSYNFSTIVADVLPAWKNRQVVELLNGPVGYFNQFCQFPGGVEEYLRADNDIEQAEEALNSLNEQIARTPTSATYLMLALKLRREQAQTKLENLKQRHRIKRIGGVTPLQLAARAKQVNLFCAMLEAGVQPKFCYKNDAQELKHLALWPEADLLHVLAKYPILGDAMQENKDDFLFISALKKRQYTLANVLLDKGCYKPEQMKRYFSLLDPIGDGKAVAARVMMLAGRNQLKAWVGAVANQQHLSYEVMQGKVGRRLELLRLAQAEMLWQPTDAMDVDSDESQDSNSDQVLST